MVNKTFLIGTEFGAKKETTKSEKGEESKKDRLFRIASQKGALGNHELREYLQLAAIPREAARARARLRRKK